MGYGVAPEDDSAASSSGRWRSANGGPLPHVPTAATAPGEVRRQFPAPQDTVNDERRRLPMEAAPHIHQDRVFVRVARPVSAFRTSRYLLACSRKEVIQPQVPLRLPCYDFAPVIELAFDRCLPKVGSRASGTPDFHGVTGGVYKARERIHRGVADPRLLAIPTSCSRVTDCNPNLDRVFPIRSTSRHRNGLSRPL